MNTKHSNHHPGHKPWIKISVAVLAFLIIASFFGSISQRLAVLRSDFLAEIIPRVLVDLTNRNRESLAINQLQVSPVLEAAAQKKADDMAQKSYFAHNSPEGITPWYWFKEAGYNFQYAGENLAIHFSDSPEVVRAWMNSPSHRDNIVNENFTEIGIAISEGNFEGRKTVFVVQMFGQPKQTLAANTAPEVIETETEIEIEPQIEETILEDDSESKTIIAKSVEDPELEILGEEAEAEVVDAQVGQTFASQNLGGQGGEVQGEKSQSPYSSFWEKLAVSPTMLLTILYIIFGCGILFLAFLGIISEVQKHHYHHIAIAALLLILILVMYFVSTHSLNEVEVLGTVLLN